MPTLEDSLNIYKGLIANSSPNLLIQNTFYKVISDDLVNRYQPYLASRQISCMFSCPNPQWKSHTRS